MKIKTNSKYVKKDDIFVCIHDELEDRHKYIKDIKRASAIIVDKDIHKDGEIPLIKVKDTNDTLFDIYNNYYESPLKNLEIIGVTGTDGKTTTSSVIKQLLEHFEETAYLGTNGFIYKDKKIKEAQKMLLMRLIYGVAIFFVTTIVQVVFGLVAGAEGTADDSSICWSCVSNKGCK